MPDSIGEQRTHEEILESLQSLVDSSEAILSVEHLEDKILETGMPVSEFLLRISVFTLVSPYPDLISHADVISILTPDGDSEADSRKILQTCLDLKLINRDEEKYSISRKFHDAVKKIK